MKAPPSSPAAAAVPVPEGEAAAGLVVGADAAVGKNRDKPEWRREPATGEPRSGTARLKMDVPASCTSKDSTLASSVGNAAIGMAVAVAEAAITEGMESSSEGPWFDVLRAPPSLRRSPYTAAADRCC